MKKILIVEDEFIIADHIKQLLEKKAIGYAKITDTYEESVDWIKNELPDLVMLDIRLFEDEDAGIRIAHFLQDHYSIPFVFLSGYSDETTLQNAKLYKPATFITKPVIEKQLVAAIEMALPDENQIKTRSVFLKGRFFENTSYEKLTRTSFSEFDFINVEIKFEDLTIVQSFNHVKRNTILLKFKQPGTFFIVSLTIEKFLDILPPFFKQVHQSFIINTRYLTARKKDNYLIVAHEMIPIGAAFKEIL